MNNTTNVTGWAELDKMNAAHYAGKKRPAWLTQALDAAKWAWKAADETLELTGASSPDTIEAYRLANDAQDWANDMLKHYNAGTTPAVDACQNCIQRDPLTCSKCKG